MQILRCAQDDKKEKQDDRSDVQDDRSDVQDDRSDVQDDRSDAQKFVTLSECEESPLIRSASRINADPSLTLRMT